MAAPMVSAMRSSASDRLAERRTRVDLSRRTRVQQRLNLRQVVEDPISLDIALAELVRLSSSHAFQDHVGGSPQQHNGVEGHQQHGHYATVASCSARRQDTTAA